MSSYEFSLRLNREVTDAEIEALYEAGCSDAAVETGPLGTLIEFDREAGSLVEAITTAVLDVEKVPGLSAVGLACDNIVTILTIAERTGVVREAVRLWATGKRGPGNFPPPVAITSGGEKLWDWDQVVPWLQEHASSNRSSAEHFAPWTVVRVHFDSTLRVMCTADRVLRARHALRSEPDEQVRGELERLLADA